MSEANDGQQWDLVAAETAYAVIARYVEHTQAAGIIIALLAGALGEEKLDFLIQSEHWQKYLGSKRALEAAQEDVKLLTQLVEQMQQRAGHDLLGEAK